MTYAWFMIALFVVLPGSCQLGFWVGRRVAARKAEKDESERSHAVAWQASLLALAALLIGFTFSMAQARYDHRKEIVLAEANDIGTTYLRTRLLDIQYGEQEIAPGISVATIRPSSAGATWSPSL